MRITFSLLSGYLYACWVLWSIHVKTIEPKMPLNVQIPASLKRDIAAAADALGQSLTTWITRTLSAALRSGEAAGKQ